MNRIDFRDQISSNKRKTFFLIFVVFLVLVSLGVVISIASGEEYFFIVLIFAIIFSLTYILVSYYKSSSIAIASVGAKLASREKSKDYYNLVEGLTIAAGLPMPKLYVMHSKQINAFASGRNPENSIICVTDGALEKLDRRELEGVLAHELGHIGNYDILYMTLITMMVGMVSIISEIFLRSLWFRSSNDNNKNAWIFLLIGIVLAIVAPIFVYFVQMSISRKREYAADATAVKFTRYPNGLIGALNKIKVEHLGEEKIPKAVAPMFFSNPLRNLGSTHPPLEKRIEALQRM